MKFGKTLPVISISKVRVNATEDPKSSIKQIISEYNAEQNKTKRPEYEAVDTDLSEHLNIPMNMDVDIYVQTVCNRSKVMGSLISFNNDDDRYMETRYNIAIFCYCPDNSVYVITTNSAWTLVQNYRNPEFPQRIADRLLTLDGPKDRSNKPLFSDISKMSERRKVGNKSITDALDEPHISLNYAARLRENASIYNLNCFQTITNKSPPVNVLINYGSVRFQCLIKTDTLQKLIEHLHTIYKKEPTQTTDNKEEEDSSVYKQYLRVPEPQVKTVLDVNLEENLRKSIQENDDDAMENYELMHLKMDEFLDATEFKLKNKKNKEEIVISEVPNLKLVIKKLRQDPIFDRIRNRGNDFRKELKHIYISFKGRTHDPIEEQLLNFLEGIIVCNHLYYFRVFKKWYYVSEDFYRQIQDEFVLYLRNCLLDNKNKAHLKHPWKDDMHEGPYNDGYMGEENFLVGDRTLTADTHIEIFDLLYYDSTNKITYLYHVKDGFNQSTRVAQDQLCNAALIVHKHFSNKNEKILKKFHEQIKTNYKKYNEKNGTNYNVPDVFAKFEDFEKLLSNPGKLVFVYAVRTSSPDISETGNAMEPNKTLTLERNLKNKIDQFEIAKSIKLLQSSVKKTLAKGLEINLNQNENYDDLSKDLFEKLILQNYLTKIDNGSDSVPKAYVNSSLLLATKEEFSISKDTSNSINGIIYNKILRPYRTYFKSLTAKLSVIKMKKQIEGTYNYKFKICEIMGEKTINSSQSKQKRKSDELTQTQQQKKCKAPNPSTSQTLT